MLNINKCRYSVEEVTDYLRSNSKNYYVRKDLEVVDVNSSAFNNGTSRDYPFCHNIKNPDTGELLKPIRGYMGFNEQGTDRCYYAEYSDSKGTIYSYNYQFALYGDNGEQLISQKDISLQQYEDSQSLARKDFANMMEQGNIKTTVVEHDNSNNRPNNNDRGV